MPAARHQPASDRPVPRRAHPILELPFAALELAPSVRRRLCGIPASDRVGFASLEPASRVALRARSPKSLPPRHRCFCIPARRFASQQNGGRDAVWSPDGRELFYRNATRMMAAKVAPAALTLRVESPRQLFEGGFEPGSQRAFDVARDGRFLMIAAGPRDSSGEPILVRNWGQQIGELVRPK